MILAPWVSALGRLLLPNACLGCEAALGVRDAEGLLCVACRSRLRALPWPRCSRCGVSLGTGAEGLPCRECADWPDVVVCVRNAFAYEDPAPAIVHGLKYRGWRRAADLMGEAVEPLCRGLKGLVVPVPSTPRRVLLRGYNQAELIARNLCAHSSLPFVDAVERRPARRSQVSLPRDMRMANVLQAFRVRPLVRSVLRGAAVILVDDVMTTGATAMAVSSVLARAGVTRVSIITFARTLPPGARATPR